MEVVLQKSHVVSLGQYDQKTLYYTTYKCTAACERIRKTGLLRLPSRTTLQSYTGPSTGEVGVTDLIWKRIKIEVPDFQPNQRMVLMKIDGLRIQRSKRYLKNVDNMIGVVDTGAVPMDVVEGNDTNNLATDLLAFVIESKNFF